MLSMPMKFDNKTSVIEVNCETDFVARRDDFKELARNLAMQVAACPNVDYVSIDDIDGFLP